MAVFHPVTRAHVDQFLTAYDTGPAVELAPIATGVENSNYYLFTATARFILTIFGGRTDLTALPYFAHLMDYVGARGIACPRFYHDAAGNNTGLIDDRPAALITFLPGHPADTRPLTPIICAQAGATLARLHLAAAGFPETRANTTGPHAWQAAIDRIDTCTTQIEPALPNVLRDEMAYITAAAPSLAGVPRGTIHGDFFPDNVMVNTTAQITAVFDFYFACTDYLSYDLALAVNAWCFTTAGVFLPDRAHAMTASYDLIRPRDAQERAAFPLLLRMAALRILTSRLVDQIFPVAGALVSAKEPREYLARLRFHRDHSRTVL